jgi:hypothetical protein
MARNPVSKKKKKKYLPYKQEALSLNSSYTACPLHPKNTGKP